MQLYHLERVVSHLQKIRTEHGVDDYHAALGSLVEELLVKDGGNEYITAVLERLGDPTLDLESLKAEIRERAAQERTASAEKPADIQASMNAIEQAIQQGMPNCKSKKQLELVLQASEALRIYLDSAYGFDKDTAAKAREGLNTLLDLAPDLAALTEKLEDSPEATTNKDFINPPRTPLDEEIVQKSLLEALAILQTSDELMTWYSSMRSTIDQVYKPRLRNELFDAIRDRKEALLAREAN